MTTSSPHDPVPKTNAMHTGSVLLTNDVGLHARPSVKLTQLAKRFGARIEFARAATGPWVDAKSPVKVMRFKAAKGKRCTFARAAPTRPRRSRPSLRSSNGALRPKARNRRNRRTE